MRKYLHCSLWILFAFATLLSSCFHKKNNGAPVITQVTNDAGDTAKAITGDFGIPEPEITPSPVQAQSISFAPGTEVVGYDASPVAPVAAVLVKNQGACNIMFWQAGQTGFADSCNLPAGFTATEIKWHPQATALFITGVANKQYQILRVKKNGEGWQVKNIFSSAHQLQNLLVCPRPFTTYDSTIKAYYGYRLFFGEAFDNSFKIASVNENGGWYYQVVGPEKSITNYEQVSPVPPSTMTADYALPVAFHPAGHELIWKNKKGELFVASYADQEWGKYQPMAAKTPAGVIKPTPNGLGFIYWQAGKPGVGIRLLAGAKNDETQLAEYNFTGSPCPVADGRGVIGLTLNHGVATLNYAPVNMPLADVVNAWMFVQTSEELDLLQKNDGLFRLTSINQLYRIYDTENYYCNGGYSASTPTRPYLVTTDVFWEIYAAAYEGLFVVKERSEAIPAFWKFINAANKSGNNTRWKPVFASLVELDAGHYENAEVKQMLQASGSGFSTVLNHDFNYSNLKPRGHYTSDEAMKKYFIAFKYFTTAFKDSAGIQDELNTLPAEIRKFAEQWIECYTGFIAGSRTPMVWSGLKNKRPAYNQYPGPGNTVFPLSWGYDNEVMFTDVYHDNVPADKQITGAGGARLLPSGLDVAAAMGNHLADQLLEDDYQKYPPLRKAISALRQNFQTQVSTGNADNLYDKWLNALATQWLDTSSAPNGKTNENIWRSKRLQTGLASWATLRHATGLVNETGAAECGEGGFEEILLRSPRGYVEPDPATFAAIADLFAATVKFVPGGIAQVDSAKQDEEALENGILKRLHETENDARMFGAMAVKEKRGEALTTEEYEKILFLGRVAEHNFLIFKSLLTDNHGLADPDPMSKIAEVFGDGNVSPYLMAAVGNTMEWDNIVPFFGRHEIVLGGTYSYYEFKSEKLLNDKEWTDMVKTQSLPAWTNSFATKQEKANPASTGY